MLLVLLTIFIQKAVFAFSSPVPLPTIYRCSDGKISINSYAPLENITAQSSQMQGAIDVQNRTFAWSVEIKSFKGFNSPMQREHFNENYLDSDQFPKATFAGRIIEEVDLQVDGVYEVRAKGKLAVHGVEMERILKATVTVKKGKAKVTSSFTVPLDDHNISIPKIVNQKISKEIEVEVNATLTAT